MSSVCYVQGLLCLGFVTSSVCLFKVGYGTDEYFFGKKTKTIENALNV